MGRRKGAEERQKSEMEERMRRQCFEPLANGKGRERAMRNDGVVDVTRKRKAEPNFGLVFFRNIT